MGQLSNVVFGTCHIIPPFFRAEILEIAESSRAENYRLFFGFAKTKSRLLVLISTFVRTS